MIKPGHFLTRHVRSTVVAGVAAVALAGGGIAYAAASDPGSSHPAAAPPAAVQPAAAPSASAPAKTRSGHHKAAAHHGVRGTVTAINGSTWTVQTRKGAVITVDVGTDTVFGTKKAPSTAASFPVGAPVAVIGSRSGTTMTAKRIFAPTPAPTPGSPSTTGPTTPVTPAA